MIEVANYTAKVLNRTIISALRTVTLENYNTAREVEVIDIRISRDINENVTNSSHFSNEYSVVCSITSHIQSLKML
jgi:hypothetical protein